MSGNIKVTIKQAQQITRQMVEEHLRQVKGGNLKYHSPLYMHSSPGIGKSSVTKQVCDDLNIGFVDLRLASMEASDVCGIPYVSHAGEDTEQMKLSVPSWVPTEDRIEAGLFPEFGVIFFDELSNAPIGVQHAAYRPILDREVQTGVKIAPGWVIMAAGNLKDDKTGAKAVAPALANRFAVHLTIRHDLQAFVEYAYMAEINSQIIGFLNFKAEALYNFDPRKNDVAFATPRSWEQASNILNIKMSEDMMLPMLAGCIGDATAAEFMQFRALYGKLPNFEKIMDGKEKYKVPKNDVGIQFAVCTTTIDCMLHNADNKERLKNLQDIIKQLPDEFAIMIFKTIKGIADNKQLSKIVVNSLENFQRVNEYL